MTSSNVNKPDMLLYTTMKYVKAAPMTYGEFLTYMDKSVDVVAVVSEEAAVEEGYLVEYAPIEGKASNHPNHDGYVSWSPKGPFEAAVIKTPLQRTDNLTTREAFTVMVNTGHCEYHEIRKAYHFIRAVLNAPNSTHPIPTHVRTDILDVGLSITRVSAEGNHKVVRIGHFCEVEDIVNV